MKIKVFSPPAYVCEHKRYHHDVHLKGLVGTVFEAKLADDCGMYRARLHDVLVALVAAQNLMATAYWTRHWLHVKLGLNDFVCFPADCCQIVNE